MSSNSHSPAMFGRTIRNSLRHIAHLLNQAAELDLLDRRDLAELALRVQSIGSHPLVTTAGKLGSTRRLAEYKLTGLVADVDVNDPLVATLGQPADALLLMQADTEGDCVRTYRERMSQLEELKHPYKTSAIGAASDRVRIERLITDSAISGDEVLDALRSELNAIQLRVASEAQTTLTRAYATALWNPVSGGALQPTEAEIFMRLLVQQRIAAERRSLPFDMTIALRHAVPTTPALAYVRAQHDRDRTINTSRSGIDVLQQGVVRLDGAIQRMRNLAAAHPPFPLAFDVLADACQETVEIVHEIIAKHRDEEPWLNRQREMTDSALDILISLLGKENSTRNVRSQLRVQADEMRAAPITRAHIYEEHQLELGLKVRPWVNAVADSVELACRTLDNMVRPRNRTSVESTETKSPPVPIRPLMLAIGSLCSEVAEHLDVLVNRYTAFHAIENLPSVQPSSATPGERIVASR